MEESPEQSEGEMCPGQLEESGGAKETINSMGSMFGNGVVKVQQEAVDGGQPEDAARLRLMEISKAVPPADEEAAEESNSHSQSSPRKVSAPSSPSSSSPRPDIEDEIRQKLMSISYSFDQPLSVPGQPVAG